MVSFVLKGLHLQVSLQLQQAWGIVSIPGAAALQTLRGDAQQLLLSQPAAEHKVLRLGLGQSGWRLFAQPCLQSRSLVCQVKREGFLLGLVPEGAHAPLCVSSCVLPECRLLGSSRAGCRSRTAVPHVLTSAVQYMLQCAAGSSESQQSTTEGSTNAVHILVPSLPRMVFVWSDGISSPTFPSCSRTISNQFLSLLREKRRKEKQQQTRKQHQNQPTNQEPTQNKTPTKQTNPQTEKEKQHRGKGLGERREPLCCTAF